MYVTPYIVGIHSYITGFGMRCDVSGCTTVHDKCMVEIAIQD